MPSAQDPKGKMPKRTLAARSGDAIRVSMKDGESYASRWASQTSGTSAGGVQTAVVRLTEAAARSLLELGRLRVGCVNCRIPEDVEVARCFRR